MKDAYIKIYRFVNPALIVGCLVGWYVSKYMGFPVAAGLCVVWSVVNYWRASRRKTEDECYGDPLLQLVTFHEPYKPKTAWVAFGKPAPEGWHFSESMRCLVNNKTGKQICDQVIALLPILHRSEAPTKEDIPEQRLFAELGLDPSLLYHDSKRRVV